MSPSSERRQRLHDLLLALIAREEDLPLMDSELSLIHISEPTRP